MATFTAAAASQLADFAGVQAGQAVLDVACGTGVVAVTAARRGAKVRALDLSQVLLEQARQNAQIAAVAVDWHEGDVEALPFADGSFDVVLSQFGHIFAPRPAVAVGEMLRVLRPGGRIAFSTWPPDFYVGRMWALVAAFSPPPPAGAGKPADWGLAEVVRARLGDAVTALEFDSGEFFVPGLSPAHLRLNAEHAAAPVARVIAGLQQEPARLAAFRAEFEAVIARWFKDNRLRQTFLMSRATRR